MQSTLTSLNTVSAHFLNQITVLDRAVIVLFDRIKDPDLRQSHRYRHMYVIFHFFAEFAADLISKINGPLHQDHEFIFTEEG